MWSRRDKSRDRDAASVVATVEQFNAVSYRVISTVLMTVEAKPQHRAKVIVKWIDIAQVCSTFLVLNIFMILLLGMYIPTLPILDFFELFEKILRYCKSRDSQRVKKNVAWLYVFYPKV